MDVILPQVILRKQITIPGKNLADKLAQADAAKNGEKLFKTFKKPTSQSTEENEVVETAAEKKKRFREQKMSSETGDNDNNNKNNNKDAEITSLPPKLSATGASVRFFIIQRFSSLSIISK